MSCLIHSLTHYALSFFSRCWGNLHQNGDNIKAWMKDIKHFAMLLIFIVPSGSHRNKVDTQFVNQSHLATTAERGLGMLLCFICLLWPSWQQEKQQLKTHPVQKPETPALDLD